MKRKRRGGWGDKRDKRGGKRGRRVFSTIREWFSGKSNILEVSRSHHVHGWYIFCFYENKIKQTNEKLTDILLEDQSRTLRNL